MLVDRAPLGQFPVETDSQVARFLFYRVDHWSGTSEIKSQSRKIGREGSSLLSVFPSLRKTSVSLLSCARVCAQSFPNHSRPVQPRGQPIERIAQGIQFTAREHAARATSEQTMGVAVEEGTGAAAAGKSPMDADELKAQQPPKSKWTAGRYIAVGTIVGGYLAMAWVVWGHSWASRKTHTAVGFLLFASAVTLLAVGIGLGVYFGLKAQNSSSSNTTTPLDSGSGSSNSGSTSGGGGGAAPVQPLPTSAPAPIPTAPPPPSTCNTPPGAARLDLPDSVPPYPGFCINWEGGDEPDYVKTRLARTPGIVCGFVQSNDPQSWDQKGFDHYVEGIANATAKGRPPSILELTLMPNYELRLLNETILNDWAKQFAKVNKQFNIPILLRFAHEMNGAWINYGMKPTQFIPAWRKFTTIVRAHTNLTAMMWAPNVGEGYPYEKSIYTPEPGTPDFKLLDTDKDGKLSPLDDPYTPYWPGAEYVDWVATSLYWTGGEWPRILNTAPPPDHVGPTIRGVSQANIDQGQAPYDFHGMFAVKYSKPMALGESGVSFYKSMANGGTAVSPGPGELTIKRAWWRQTFNNTLHKSLPRLKGIVHFDVRKDDGRGAVDYMITDGPVLPEFKKDLELQKMTWADQVLAWQCDGTVALVPGSTKN